jgi:hypothetical protein
VRLEPSPKLSEYVEALFVEKRRNAEDRKGHAAQSEKQNRSTLQLSRQASICLAASLLSVGVELQIDPPSRMRIVGAARA